MIDPHNVTKFERTDAELEELILFSIAVAGKRAVTISEKLERFLWLARSRCGSYYRKEMRKPQDVTNWSPFKLIRVLNHISVWSKQDELLKCMQAVKLGKYNILKAAFTTLSFGKLDLRKCPLERLETVKGIGFKTSRFFVLHSRPNQSSEPVDRGS